MESVGREASGSEAPRLRGGGLGEGGGGGGAGEGVAGDYSITLGHRWGRPGKDNLSLAHDCLKCLWRT